MRKTVLYIAMSLDGYIADCQGGVAWLGGDGCDPDHPGSYPAFYESVDAIVMGYKTYHQIATELSPDKWYYAGKMSYVITSHPEASNDEIRFLNEDPSVLIEHLKKEEGKNIWICGGAEIVNQLVETNMIDRYHITMIPHLLGDGVRLFHKHDQQDILLKLVKSESWNGMVDLVYERRNQQ